MRWSWPSGIRKKRVIERETQAEFFISCMHTEAQFKRHRMPILSMFYGIVVYMYFYDNKKHNVPHFHVEYAE